MDQIAVYPLVFLVAAIYSSVGHGGASGYLAVLALFGFMPLSMVSSALVLNLLVAGTAFVAYWKSGHFLPGIFWPFALTSIPCAFLGGLVQVPTRVYSGLLAVVLGVAAFRLALTGKESEPVQGTCAPNLGWALPLGAVIGFFSGLLGVGGGIFLSPLLILCRWANAKQTAAASAAFIWVNSMAALYGHVSRQKFDVKDLWMLVLAAFLGGLAGSSFGVKFFRASILKRVLAGVLVAAAFKMLKAVYG